MFLQILEALGTFFGGLGALTAATTQLLTFLKKKEDERGGACACADACADESNDWMIPLGPVPHFAPAA
ncbi:hypothetical protein MMF93_15070 [Streptomyces tubbatahanensis]|uniref:Uncharacterized protein n=1 Tax=Streptomyces tubbatahanensis TaxID=2923272 RepID=A0ABY3XT86_9ACTN|nr:hypothetical protein [Streptomyces tubbatahanensis]UNS97662.1 hypothetical protein MMF93_15070 [Streptomyces tubbatahanensis]